MHTRIRRASLLVLAALQTEACLKKHLPPEDYGITETISKTTVDGGAKKEALEEPLLVTR